MREDKLVKMNDGKTDTGIGSYLLQLKPTTEVI